VNKSVLSGFNLGVNLPVLCRSGIVPDATKALIHIGLSRFLLIHINKNILVLPTAKVKPEYQFRGNRLNEKQS
jgi:hypothetical protein